MNTNTYKNKLQQVFDVIASYFSCILMLWLEVLISLLVQFFLVDNRGTTEGFCYCG